MNTRIKAIYGRQSVDKQDSISIESQLEFCQYELKGENYRTYTDKGFSGKNTDRPKFQELIRDIEQGLISTVVVYKLDRISRSIIDFAKMMELFQRYNVEFVSATEKFDTSTPMGRAMLNICIVFAQLERETIQKRVQDAFHSRCRKGFHMSGKAPYGYTLEPTVMDGVRTKKMVADPVAADHIRLMYEMYAKPGTSFGDIIRYFLEQGISTDGVTLTRSQISHMLKNPVYAQADLDMYDFFKAHGADVVNEAADFTGTNGCYFYAGRDARESKKASLKDHTLVIAPHEGIVPSDIWLACRRKMMNNIVFPGSHKAKNTWLAGKAKCGRCGAALMSIHNVNGTSYFRCRKRADAKTCEGCGTLRVHEVEASIYNEMVKKLRSFQILTKSDSTKANPKLTALNVELAQVDTEIEKLLDSLSGANATLLSYANSKIEELDTKRQSLMKTIADMRTSTLSPEHAKSISGYLENWEDVSFEDKRLVLDGLISKIQATSERVRIEWKI
ncbi:MAG: recombinase family protein [Oscillospiraceae bacterium]|nr:recombinase family protein [Oscillospiraceae bacterium]